MKMKMKKLLVALFVLSAMSVSVNAQTNAPEGDPVAIWSHPLTGNPPVLYHLTYEVNGDSTINKTIPGTSLADTTIQLGNVGDWVYLGIVSEDFEGNFSISGYSDTCYFNTGVVNPPGFISWDVGSSPARTQEDRTE